MDRSMQWRAVPFRGAWTLRRRLVVRTRVSHWVSPLQGRSLKRSPSRVRPDNPMLARLRAGEWKCARRSGLRAQSRSAPACDTRSARRPQLVGPGRRGRS